MKNETELDKMETELETKRNQGTHSAIEIGIPLKIDRESGSKFSLANKDSIKVRTSKSVSIQNKTVTGNRTLSAYAVNALNQPEDEWQIDSKDENLEFFQKGRDYQPRKQKHHFTEEEKEIMGTYESSAIKPSHTAVYRHWLASLPPRSDSESWFIIALVAVIIGTLAFVMKMICERLQIFYNPFIKDFVERGKAFRLWLYMTGMSCAFGALSAVVIIYISPHAGGSGVPEIIGVLNGCVVRNVLGIKTLACKIVSCVFTVISGLPVGFEGPMIHIGAMVAALMARPCHCQTCRDNIYTEPPRTISKDNCCKTYFKKICRYRDCQERHNLICVGTAAGVASAFSSPITGLAFAMEEMSTHWSNSLTWQTFVCCILSRSTTELLHSIISTVEEGIHSHKGELNIFELSESALFDMKVNLQLSLAVFIPTLIIGVMGGLLGSLYIFMHLKMAKYRRRLLNKIKRTELTNAFKVLEVVTLCFICSSLTMMSMPLFNCNRVNHSEEVATEIERRHMILRTFNCDRRLRKVFDPDASVIQHIGEFHEGASLMFGSWEQMIRNLLSRKTADFFGITCLFLIFLFFFIFSSWSAMTSIASGLLIPQLSIGALFGRMVGKCIFDIFKENIHEKHSPVQWDFTDPGALALLGAASFFAGTSRLPITSVVMMAEMTNDINMSLLVMICVMLAKFIGELFTHSLFHSLLEFKCIPILEPELKIYHKNKRVDLELFPISLVMAVPVKTAKLKASVYDLANLLLDTNHGAFPVVKNLEKRQSKSVFMGLISRMELTILLTKTEGFDINELNRDDIDKIRITYPEYNSTKLKDCAITNKILQIYSSDLRYANVYVNLYPYINLSSQTITTTFSLHRSYGMFRDLGLRHLVIVNEYNEVKGIITRKDLLGFVVEEKIRNEIVQIKQRNRMRRRRELDEQRHKSNRSGHRMMTVDLKEDPNVDPSNFRLNNNTNLRVVK